MVEGEEPLVLIGADLMAPSHSSRAWDFESIGVDARTKVGFMRFTKGGARRVVQLLAWPIGRPGATKVAR